MDTSGIGFSMRRALRVVLAQPGLLWLACLLLLGLALPQAARAVERVTIYTYHTHPPFITGAKRGLTYDLAAFLTKYGAGRYAFNVREASRPALDKLIATPVTGIVPWVSPDWFGDRGKRKYLWSTHVFMRDRMVIVSRADRRIEYDGVASLAGLTFGGIRGHRYVEIDDYIRDAKTLRRLDADRHLDNFRKLVKQHIDVTLLPESAARYFLQREHLSNLLYIASKPHSEFECSLFVINRRQDILAYIDQVFASAAARAEWEALFRNYQ